MIDFVKNDGNITEDAFSGLVPPDEYRSYWHPNDSVDWLNDGYAYVRMWIIDPIVYEKSMIKLHGFLSKMKNDNGDEDDLVVVQWKTEKAFVVAACTVSDEAFESLQKLKLPKKAYLAYNESEFSIENNDVEMVEHPEDVQIYMSEVYEEIEFKE